MKLRHLFLPILLCICLCFGGCQIADTVLLNLRRVFGPQETTRPYYIEDSNGLVIPNYDISTAPYDTSLFVSDEEDRMTYADAVVQTQLGIDVSAWQGEIDWQAVADDGIDFAILRAVVRGWGANGLLSEDERIRENLEGATQAGLDVGVYVFSQAITVQEALEEAELVLQIVEGYDITYPIVFDWEKYPDEPTSRTLHLPSETLNACAQAFCSRIEQAGYDAMIYINLEFGYYEYDLEHLQDYDLWLSQYADKPTYYYRYTMWQYSKTGTVAGINGNVDMNICLYDYTAESAATETAITEQITGGES